MDCGLKLGYHFLREAKKSNALTQKRFLFGNKALIMEFIENVNCGDLYCRFF